MKKSNFIYLLLVLQTACNGGGGGPTAQPNSITSTAVSLNSPSSARIVTIRSKGAVVSMLSGSSIWTTSFTGTSPTWELLTMPGVASALTINNAGTRFACNESGNCYLYNNNGSWGQQGGATEDSKATSMVVANGSSIYMGNAAGTIWRSLTDGDSFSNISTSSGISEGIVELALDKTINPAFLGAASGASVYAYRISNPAWRNLTTEAGSLYTDPGSKVNSIAFYNDGNIDYGYIANASGHVWQSIYNTSTGQVKTITNMTTTFPGWSGSGPATQVAVSSQNVVYAGTANGQVLIWTPSTVAWSNITPSGSTAPISALWAPGGNSVFVGNASGQIWSVTWQ